MESQNPMSTANQHIERDCHQSQRKRQSWIYYNNSCSDRNYSALSSSVKQVDLNHFWSDAIKTKSLNTSQHGPAKLKVIDLSPQKTIQKKATSRKPPAKKLTTGKPRETILNAQPTNSRYKNMDLSNLLDMNNNTMSNVMLSNSSVTELFPLSKQLIEKVQKRKRSLSAIPRKRRRDSFSSAETLCSDTTSLSSTDYPVDWNTSMDHSLSNDDKRNKTGHFKWSDDDQEQNEKENKSEFNTDQESSVVVKKTPPSRKRKRVTTQYISKIPCSICKSLIYYWQESNCLPRTKLAIFEHEKQKDEQENVNDLCWLHKNENKYFCFACSTFTKSRNESVNSILSNIGSKKQLEKHEYANEQHKQAMCNWVEQLAIDYLMCHPNVAMKVKSFR
ncbi:unnamed protein product [Didymodactylos carnosus]|uniref:Uncharacterized protein n=1 Tax=Didymodactylos carnosus TaxID=1234261 RepID=A0A815B184_9BILA|nr:unnamed protein product [Didymodactylos carnosus]CAF4045730.1 unnamed protein product [Didymodactylos carnosus]